jgi:hypothetical protein
LDRDAPFALTLALLLVAEVGVEICPGRVLRALAGDDEGPDWRLLFTLVWTTGAGFFIFVAVVAGFAMTVAMIVLIFRAQEASFSCPGMLV